MPRLTRPLIRTQNQYREISFEEAFQRVAEQGRNGRENATLVLTSGDYSNEELYLLQRLARAGLRTNAIGSFDYYDRGTDFFHDKNDILPYAELFGSDLLLCLLDEKAENHSMQAVRSVIDSCTQAEIYRFNQPDTLHIRHHAMFFRCLNYYLIRHNLAKGIYVDGLGKHYDEYKTAILQEDFNALLGYNALTEEDVRNFVGKLLHAEAPAFIVWERWLDARAVIELENLCMLLDIQAKPSSGFLCIKADLNSQGLYDMGIFPDLCVSGEPFDTESVNLMQELYGQLVCTTPIDISATLRASGFDTILLMNATGVSIPDDILQHLPDACFTILQKADWDAEYDYRADLILPASLPEETFGTYTDSARTPHQSKAALPCPIEYDTLHQLSAIGQRCGLSPMEDPTEIFMEYISFMKGGCHSQRRHFFR
jgi:predicted molibdopterin-dependent oxidoreductase YjgC